MRIPCPYCGDRTHAEFSYLGDAAPVRPLAMGGADQALFHDYVYLRANPAGRLTEWWQHTGGCRAWLAVERDATTHAVGRVTAARERSEGASVR